MSLDSRVLSSIMIGGVPHVVTELKINPRSALVGKRISEIEMGYAARVLARTSDGSSATLQSPPSPATAVNAGDTLVIHTATSQLVTLATAGAARD
jgi:Trk K+ transport system NAD-binding subunit